MTDSGRQSVGHVVSSVDVDENEFRDAVLSYARSPKNGALQQSFTHQHVLRNPLCGDEVEIRLSIVDGSVAEVSFRARGCAVCTASSAIMNELLPGMAVDEVRRTAGAFESFLFHYDHAGEEDSTVSRELPRELRVFTPLQANPRRRECAYLPWRVIRESI